MFNKIAHSYDALNHILSLGVDRSWRRSAVKHVQKHTRLTPTCILDVAAGTGDLSILTARTLHPDKLIGVDISDGMMEIGRKKAVEQGVGDIVEFQHQDCSAMTFPDGMFDTVVSSFGLRNFQNLDACLQEIRRVMKDGATFVAIDLCVPVAFPMKQLFYIYKKAVMPIIGKIISKDDSAYTYLPSTMEAIPQGDDMVRILQKCGFNHVTFNRLRFGLCILYQAEK